MPLEDIAGVRLAIDRYGSGAPTLIFVHGGFCNRHDWAAQINALATRFRLVTLDMPGHGESPLPAEFTVAALAQAVCGVKAQARGPVVLVGHSLGVDVILEAWRQSSEQIAALSLIEGGLVADGDPDEAAAAVESKMDAVGLDVFLDAAFRQMFTHASDPQMRDRVLARLRQIDRAFAREIILSKVRWDARFAAPVLASVTVPLQLIQSTHFDETFQRRSLPAGTSTPWIELVLRQQPASEICHVSGVGHFPQIEAAPLVNDCIRSFVDRLRR